MFQLRRTYYFNGSRPGHLLALRLKHNEKHSNILAIKSPHTLTEPGEINSAFKAFYSTLYKSEVTLDPNTGKNFFHGLDLPYLSRQEAKGLNSPISLEELREALVNMKKGKPLGWVSIPPNPQPLTFTLVLT